MKQKSNHRVRGWHNDPTFSKIPTKISNFNVLPSPLLVLLDSQSKKSFKDEKANRSTQRPIDWILFILCHLPNRYGPMGSKNNSRNHRFYCSNQLHHC
ncbi:CLUMA_CG015488, isoform A [Clunio marinus]|uniref:CLUMA_CG015488, isoform A n=1 Tax=Clunio marinus TaxID=568069 RepID=A0A1J1IPH5_9DIPT|nr:CLUMA_CG015488, isoform A [Clunio marinus]